MSKYHPLDVRHPANRALEKRDFLLGPPVASTPAESNRAASTPAGTTRSRRAAEAVSPWGKRAAPAPAAAPSEPRRQGGRVMLIVALVVLFLVAREGGLGQTLWSVIEDLTGGAQRLLPR